VIEVYARISGAKLSQPKSLTMPLDSKPIPEWFQGTGCQMAIRGQVYKYLGCPIAINLSPEPELDFLLETLRKKLRHWSQKLLSMAGRVVYIKHVLRSVPIYNLMVLEYS
jgi:hypothetical protein